MLAAPGHDPESVILFDDRHGVLISADALWENGFGVVFPELDGSDAFDDVARVLDLIETLPVRCVIPGHGAPFTDVAARVAACTFAAGGFRASPARHLRHGAKVLLKYHLMEEREQALPARARLAARHAVDAVDLGRAGPPRRRLRRPGPSNCCRRLLAGGVLGLRGDIVHDV